MAGENRTMTKNQNIVMWCGVIILMVYLFTDKKFKNAIFGKTASGGTATQTDAVTIPDNTTTYWDYPGTATMPAPSKKVTTL
jgi:hypothetical protein